MSCLLVELGMGLAVAGAVLQVLFNNPLCEPYTLGIASGSACGAVLGLNFLPFGLLGLDLGALLGALLFYLLLELVSRRIQDTLSLLLVGLMLGFLGNSLVGIWFALTDSQGWVLALGWLFGDLSRARLQSSLGCLFSILCLSGLLWREWLKLDALLLGEECAQTVGVDVFRIRRKITLLSSTIVSICVASGGIIGFVGLVSPHFVRKWVGSLHAWVIPLSMMWGSILLMASDCLARSLSSAQELPIGVVTALLGAPLFLFLLFKQRREEFT